MGVLSEKEVDSIIAKCKRTVEDRMAERIKSGKTRSIGQLDVDSDEERIDAATSDEISEMQSTVNSLREDLEAAEARENPETDLQSDIDDRDQLRSQIDKIESAIESYGPRA